MCVFSHSAPNLLLKDSMKLLSPLTRSEKSRTTPPRRPTNGVNNREYTALAIHRSRPLSGSRPQANLNAGSGRRFGAKACYEFVKCTLLIDHATEQLAFTACVFKDCNIDRLQPEEARGLYVMDNFFDRPLDERRGRFRDQAGPSSGRAKGGGEMSEPHPIDPNCRMIPDRRCSIFHASSPRACEG